MKLILPVAISTVFVAFLFLTIELNAQNLVSTKNNNSFDELSLREMMRNDGLSELVINKLIEQRKQLVASGRKVEWKNHKKISNTPVPFASCSDIGVENGWGAWQAAEGTNTAGNPPVFASPINPFPPRFNLTTGTGVDFTTYDWIPELPVVAPGFGIVSIQLGEPGTAGSMVDQLTYPLAITDQNSDFVYTYAAVIFNSNVGHLPNEQPFVDFVILDSNGDTVPCSYRHIVCDPSLPTWYPANWNYGYYFTFYTLWTTVGVNLANYIGTTLTIVVTNADCTDGAHYAHSYWDFTCGNIPTEYCAGQQLTLCAPIDPAVSYTYQWYQNGNLFPGSNTSCIVTSPLPGDTFTVDVNQPSGCNFSINYVPQDTCLAGGSGNEILDNIFINVFPNPSSGNLFIDFGNKNFGEAEIYLTDIFGEILITENKLGTGKLSFDISSLSNGVYFVRINTEAGSVTKKIVISR